MQHSGSVFTECLLHSASADTETIQPAEGQPEGQDHLESSSPH